MLEDFKAFIARGNVVDMAVGGRYPHRQTTLQRIFRDGSRYHAPGKGRDAHPFDGSLHQYLRPVYGGGCPQSRL